MSSPATLGCQNAVQGAKTYSTTPQEPRFPALYEGGARRGRDLIAERFIEVLP